MGYSPTWGLTPLLTFYPCEFCFCRSNVLFLWYQLPHLRVNSPVDIGQCPHHRGQVHDVRVPLGVDVDVDVRSTHSEILDKITANKPAKKPNATSSVTSSATALTGYQPINPSISLAVELTRMLESVN